MREAREPSDWRHAACQHAVQPGQCRFIGRGTGLEDRQPWGKDRIFEHLVEKRADERAVPALDALQEAA